ncbi:MAG TPA: hypothetical protein DCW68_04710 [Rhodospirillaceae bacterium]|nr:MAG: hypothetical protein A2018_02935 [Alphaproteobacteria bacterium GWF2_58_20]HAU29397.1 hypothetical protein [Rhodospirillaceae bacterium]
MKKMLFAVATLALWGCAMPLGGHYVEAGRGYDTIDRIHLDVSDIEVVDRYIAPFAPPHVDHMFAKTPTMAIHDWVSDRLMVDGVDGRMEVVILDAGVVEEVLPKKGGFEGLFTNEQDVRYTGRLEVAVKMEKPSAQYLGTAQVVAQRSVTVPESASMSDREMAWGHMTSAMMGDLDRAMEQALREKLPRSVKGEY